ncbi:MAG: single-stranded-DNA-specific exonuclease RecJ [Bacteroidetes bacterium]|nr:single-stranded-DNA-specific exonuclease RecJ [Bacteroidota bacterium]MBL0050756.1 single-stranded-DNA-specific exonuclease RecJ [Bacteroidota bacterium]
MTDKRWVSFPNLNHSIIDSLHEELKIHPVLCSLLVQRGITNFEEARNFFRPSLEMLHDPFLMKDMDIAVERINTAIAAKEKIMVYGDYDVDGTTAVSLMYLFLRSLFANVEFYIPNRYSEGYGVSITGIDVAKQNGCTLIIALDCGIKAMEKVDYANSLGIDFIICDHHRPSATLPAAVAVLDPKRNDCEYPYKELTGCGIGFKLAQAIAQNNNIPFSDLDQYLDLVAISIAADIVEILGENRILMHYGLKRLNQNPRQGLKAIMHVGNIDKKQLDVSDIVFVIAPRINAAGRIESGNQAVELLTAKDVERAIFHGGEIDEKNTTRKELDQNITEHAFQMIESDPDFVNRKSTVVFHTEWHKGVIGIVASRLSDRYYRPTIVLTLTNGHVAGSARSVKDFDIYNAIESCSDLLDQFGGHMYAAGLTMKEENVPAFIEKFEKIVAQTIETNSLTKEITVDAVLDLKEITPKFYKILKQFSPFGPGNMAPVFQTNNLVDSGYGRVVGNNHLKLSLTQDGPVKYTFDAIAFQLGEHIGTLEKKVPLDVVYHIDENHFNGKTTLQLNVKDIRVNEIVSV